MAAKSEDGVAGEVRIRGYRRTDLPAMVRLDRLCFAPEFLFSKAAMRGFAEAGGAYAVMAEKNDVLVGFVIGQMEREEDGRVEGYCVTLDVAPGERRGGVGGLLLRELEQWAGAEGAREMVLHVYVGNEAARGFYAGRGYWEVQLVKGFYRHGLDGVECRKELRRD